VVPGLAGACVAANAAVEGMSRHVAVMAPIAILRRRDGEGCKIGFLLDHGQCFTSAANAAGVASPIAIRARFRARHF